MIDVYIMTGKEHLYFPFFQQDTQQLLQKATKGFFFVSCFQNTKPAHVSSIFARRIAF